MRVATVPGMTTSEDFAGHAGGRGGLHHVELWVPDLRRAAGEWGWLLGQLGYLAFQEWAEGRSWRLGSTYIVIEQSSAMLQERHDRRRPGLNHLAFHSGRRTELDVLMSSSTEHGWAPLFAETYPHAGGELTYAGYLENTDGFEVELVAT